MLKWIIDFIKKIIGEPTMLGMSYKDKKAVIDLITENEGGWVNDKDDKGGETYKGVARNFHPNWKGWKTIDLIDGKRKGQLFNNSALDKAVVDFYVNTYFPKKCFDIKNKGVLFCVLDWMTTSRWAMKKIQQAFKVGADNVIGKNTVKAINSVEPSVAIDMITQARIKYYKSLKNPKFEKGWINRCHHTEDICIELIG